MPSLFAAHRVQVHATDIHATSWRARRWIEAEMHAAGVESLHFPHLVDRETLLKRVSFTLADMRGRWSFESGSFDIVWSCCSLEHLGSLKTGMDFVLRSARLLKPGGVGVYTTEYNVSSNDKTQEGGTDVIYRRRDIEDLDYRLRRDGLCLVRPDFDPGDHAFDREYDFPPFYSHGRQHIKVLIGDFIATSILLIVLA
jgi:SAM-dependent methyltransferase